MSVVLIDDVVVIDRIIEILQNDTSVFDKGDPQGKLRKVLFSESDGGKLDDSTPYAWIAPSSRYRTTRESIGSGNVEFHQGIGEYVIGVVAQRRAAEETMQELLKFVRLIIEALRKNPKLGKPSDITTDQQAKRINILRTERFFPQQGKALDGMRIILVVQVGVEWQLDITGSSLVLDLISKPLDEDNINVDTDLEDDGLISLTKVSDPGSLDVEFESDAATDATLKALISSDLEKTAILKRGGVTVKTMTVKFLGTRKPVPYDNIEKTILSMQLIQ